MFVVPHAARDAVFGWGSGGDESSPASGTATRGADAKTKMSKSRKKGAGGAWGRAGADEMDAYLAAGGLMDRRGGLAGGGLGHNADFVREAALDALEAIVTSGGAMLPANVRTLADAAAAEAASRAVLAATAGYGSGTTQSLEARAPMAVRARRAAYALLLASTLAPRPFRATNLPLAASVFRAARNNDAALSAEAARAALAVEALLHPAAPPLHPRAIAPPRNMNGNDGMYETGAFGNDGLGGASWGGDDSVARDAPAWGNAAPEREEESEEEEEEERREEKGIADDAAVSRGAPGPPKKSGASSEPNEPTKREASPPALPRGAKKAKAEAEKDDAEGVPDAPSGRASRSRAASARENAPAASAPEPKLKPKRQTAKEKAAAAKAAKAEAEAAAAAAAAATSNPKPVGLGLGSGKSSVALELSDSDSDGELPEIVDE